MAYLDHNATSPLRPQARDAILGAMEICGNPTARHGGGRAARAVIEAARAQVADLAGVAPDQVIFTSGASEANALALHSGAKAVSRILVGASEHASVHANALAQALPVEILPVDAAGRIDPSVLDATLAAGGPALVAVMAANNETGVLQDIPLVAAHVARHGGYLLCDAVQSAGKADIPAADYVSLSAHKIGGPTGIGALIVRPGVPFDAVIRGGGQEGRRRAGTENLTGIAGFGAAAQAVRAEGKPDPALRDCFETGLRALAPEAVIFGAAAARLPNTSFFAVPGMRAEVMLAALDLDGVQVSTGSACSAGLVEPSYVLKAMRVDAVLASCALRVSFGWNSYREDVDALLASLARHLARAATCAA